MRDRLIRVVKRASKKIITLSAATVMAFSSLAAAAPIFIGTAAAAATPTVVVSSANTQGWTTDDTRPGGGVSFVKDSSAVGGSALRLTTDSTTTSKAQFTTYFSPIPLANINDSSLNYSTKQNSGAFAGADPAYQLYVYVNGSSGFDTFTYEPYVNEGTAAIHQGQWQNWDVGSGKFYSSHNFTGSGGSVQASQGTYTYTLSEIRSDFPDINVIGIGVNIGSNNPSYDVEADAFGFNGTIYDFETAPSVASGDFAICTKTAGCGYDGIDVGFPVADFDSISGISVTLSKNGQDLVTNTAKQDMLDYYNNGTGTVLSTPFVISAGTFDPATDTYWSYGTHNWKATEQPDTATVTVTGIDSSGNTQTISTPNSSLTQGLASFASFFPGQLTVGYNPGDYSSIQAAVNAAAAGDIIYVANGIYNEAINITQNNLSLVGQSQTGVIVNQTAATTYGQGISIDGFSGTSISNMTFNTPAGSPVSYALQAYQASTLNLSNLTFNGPGKTGVNSHGSKIGGVDINSSSNISYDHVNVSNYSKNGFSVTAKYTAGDTASANLSFGSVTASGNNWAGLAFYGTNSSGSVGNNITGVTFSGANSFTGNGQGVFVEGDSDANFGAGNAARYAVQGTSGATLAMSGADISGNVQEIVNYQSGDFNASGNWWGGALGPNTSDYSGSVTVNNWCTTNACTTTQSAASGSTTLPTTPIATPTVDNTTNTSSITLPSTNNVTATTSTLAGNIQITIPAGTTVTADNTTWDGTISPPTVLSNTSVTNLPSGTSANSVIEVGSTTANLTFSQSVRLFFAGQAGKSVGFVRNGNFTTISTKCNADNQATVDTQLGAGGDCYIDSGSNDLAVWTKHFTEFVTYSQTQNPATSSNSSGSSTAKTASAASGNNSSSDTGVVQGESTTNGQTSSTNTEVPATASIAQPKIAAKEAAAGGLRWYWIVLLAIVIVGLGLATVYRYAEGTDRK